MIIMQRFSGRNEYINSRLEESVFNKFGSDQTYSSLNENDKKIVLDSLKVCNTCESLTLKDEKVCWDCGSKDLHYNSKKVFEVIQKLEV